ncbi:phage tail assembly chaperone [Kosakonia sacchari]|uniref:phage tail assembly chaperone n=1 Tax=Kosakonia sacchari TaxID=1158459 RepID=UPI001585186E|nr:hypothetical protein [Kosakonia sacchari]NUL35041.1 hypothetical protein [Kosakonia sacchari]
MDDSIKHVTVNDRVYTIIRMGAFDAVHFNLRVAEILSKHGINQMESILTMSAKVFGVLNREDHDELLFELLTKSRAQVQENGDLLTDWGVINQNFTAANIADVYLLAVECLKFSILPVVDGLKKNIGLDTAATMRGAMQTLFKALLATLTGESAQN